MPITLQDLYDAYRKFKTFVYYNGQTLSLRRKLAEFELDMLAGDSLQADDSINSRSIFKEKFNTRITPLLEFLNNPNDKSAPIFQEWLKAIKYTVIPKQLKESDPPKEHFISNEVPMEDFVVQKCNFIIDAPIELHLISTLWTIKVGRYLYPQISHNNYAYRLSIFDRPDQSASQGSDSLTSGLMMYEPYFMGYQQWRDNGLNKVSQVLSEGENAVLLSLDVKRYFYNVRINVMDLVKHYDINILKKVENNILSTILQKIHEQYSSLFSLTPNDSKVMLPIGLPSSGLLGNLVLKPFDDYIRNHVTPAYYGRYVDDILLVFSGKGLTIKRHPESQSFIDGFITEHLVLESGKSTKPKSDIRFSRTVNNKETASHTKKDEKKTGNGKNDSENSSEKDTDLISGISYCIECGDSKLEIQLGKVIMEYFNCNESKAAINKFKKQLEKNRSEFRYLPWEEEINLEFDDEAFKLEISDSLNKLRNIEGISEDKYGASKYLAKKIFLSTLPFQSDSKEEAAASATQILTYFKGRTAILMNSLWEKVATYFVIKKEPKHLATFCRQAIDAIERIKVKKADVEDSNIFKFDDQQVKKALKEHLRISIAMAVAIVPDILSMGLHNIPEFSEINEISIKFRRSYLFRHQYEYLKGYCYTLSMDDNDPLVGKDLISTNIGSISTNSFAPYVSPVFLKPHEITLLQIYHELSNNPSTNESDIDRLNFIDLDKQYDIFQQFNYDWRFLFEDSPAPNKTKSLEYCLKVENIKDVKPPIQIVEVNDDNKESSCSTNKKIGIVNWRIDKSDLIKSVLGQPNKSPKRRENLFEVLNYSATKHVEMLVFPETSIPVEWLPLIVDHAVRNNCAIIGGLEFYVTPSQGDVESENYLKGMYAYNFSFSILPFKMRLYDTAAIVLRKKNYYAPGEQTFIDSYHKLEPPISPMYHMIHWRKTYFSIYNCFELSNISDRAIFKSKVDFLVAIEYNRDTNYFANITEAWTRDLHCYIIQTNSSDYGDTKVVQPTKSENLDVMKIKGGEFPLVMITVLDIDKLRNHHRKSSIGQLNDKPNTFFKPTPARYEWQWAERRIANVSPSKYWFNIPTK